ncbi:hypothetical protein ACFE04_028883 [Oxalis oulophora]
MFKLWRNDKNKIKMVFRLQFQVTQVPKLKKPALMISLVPEDVGKPTMRLQKTAVQDGTCTWENPLYTTMKLIKDPKSGKFNEKIYHFLVSTGSSKSGFLGEASVDFADFAEEIELLTISLPLKFANSGAVLHVTIQKMEGVIDPRDIDETEDLTLSQGGSFKSQQNNHISTGNNLDDDEVTSRDDELDGSFGSFNEQLSRQVLAMENSQIRQNSMPKKGNADVTKTKMNMHKRSFTDWSVGSASDGSLAESYGLEDSLPREYQKDTNDTTEKLRCEIAGLLRQAELSELELQSLRKQITKETKRAQDLSRQVSSVKEERDEWKIECERLKSHKCIDRTEVMNQLRSENSDLRILVEEMKQELDHEEDAKANLQLQLQKTQGSTSELLLDIRDLNEMLEEKNREISHLSNKVDEMDSLARNSKSNEHEEVKMLKGKITDLETEIMFYRKHKEELETHIEELTEDFEVLKQENSNIRNQISESRATVKELELHIQELEEKIKQQSQEYSESLIARNDLESWVKELRKELEKQAEEFDNQLEDVVRAKSEQEQRAIQAEENVRKVRRQNAITAERLQEKFKSLSVEMTSKLDENENLTNEALAEGNELRAQKDFLEAKLQKATEELELIKDQNEAKCQELSKQIEKMSLQLDQQSKKLQYADKCEKEKLKDQMGQMKTPSSCSETAKLIQRWNEEREILEKKFSSAKKEAETARKEVMSMSGLKDEKEMMMRNLQSEVEKLKHSLSGEKLEKDNLQKEISQLRDKIDRMPIQNSITRNRENNGEVEILNEKNKCMERELKEMEERYSEISLKFAEVEGERQQLVMTVRNLKNGRKS